MNKENAFSLSGLTAENVCKFLTVSRLLLFSNLQCNLTCSFLREVVQTKMRCVSASWPCRLCKLEETCSFYCSSSFSSKTKQRFAGFANTAKCNLHVYLQLCVRVCGCGCTYLIEME